MGSPFIPKNNIKMSLPLFSSFKHHYHSLHSISIFPNHKTHTTTHSHTKFDTQIWDLHVLKPGKLTDCIQTLILPPISNLFNRGMFRASLSKLMVYFDDWNILELCEVFLKIWILKFWLRHFVKHLGCMIVGRFLECFLLLAISIASLWG